MSAQERAIFSKYTDAETFEKIKEYKTVGEMWKACVSQYADRVAIEDGGEKYTFSRLEEDAARFRTLLAGLNLRENARVAVLCANSYDFVKAFLAITTSALTAVILPAQLDEKSVYGCCMKFGVSALVYQEQLAEKTALAAKLAPKVARLCCSDTSEVKTPVTDCSADTPCVIMFTGGTTGKSKGALLSNGAVMQGTVNGCYGFKDVFYQRYLLILPLSHVFGLVRNLMTSLYTGSALYICKNNKDMFRDIAVFKPTILVAVPALAEMALALSRKFGRNMLGADMKYVICGAAAVAPYLIGEYAKIGIALLPGYGLTESANLVSGNPECAMHPDSVGYPYPNQQLRFVDGELWLKGENIMLGYIGEQEESFTPDGWFCTGDLAHLDENGLLYITGRIKEIIVLSNGENVSPAEVEFHFNELSCIQDSQVFEDVNESGAHILALEVVPRMTELAGLTPEQVGARVMSELERVNAELPPYQRVNKMVIRDKDFDRSPSMKILRYKKCN